MGPIGTLGVYPTKSPDTGFFAFHFVISLYPATISPVIFLLIEILRGFIFGSYNGNANECDVSSKSHPRIVYS